MLIIANTSLSDKFSCDANRLRLCVLAPLFYTEHQLNLLAQRLVEKGASVLVIARQRPGNSQRREACGSVQVVRIPPCTARRVGSYAMMIPAFVELVRWRRRYDLIYVAKFPTLGPVAIVAAWLFGKGCVLKAECNGEMSGQIFFYLNERRLCYTRLFKWMFNQGLAVRNWLLRKANFFVAMSREIEREFQDSGVPKEKICYIPNGIDTNRFFPISEGQKGLLRKRLSLPTEGVIVCYCGRLVRGKGLEFLLRGWKEISPEHPEAHLLIVGTGENWFGGYEHSLKLFVETQGLTECTTFTGYAENVEDFLRASDVFVYPSENEGFGVAIIEAMACGLPVVASRLGGIIDLVVPGEMGILTEPRRPNQLSRALKSLIADTKLRKEMGRKGCQRIGSRFSMDRVVSLYMEAFAGFCVPDQQ